MARVNVYLPDDLAANARAADLNVSGLAQAAIQRALDDHSLDLWLDEVAALPPTGIDEATAHAAVAAAKDELEFGK
ncbi:type II toxin-antitoxin system CcdA family antitoxin [Candidatus Poriferisodalis sp.]|uniref:type II toxin-antitoxin system CcdA family antitoxin n=1 Tax=Candidatus Poriferisodalis sp. TaxID=3101277 RepID=UPI003C70603C